MKSFKNRGLTGNLFTLAFTLSLGCAFPQTTLSSNCEPITVPMCSSDLSYNNTIHPNIIGYSDQNTASLTIHQFYPLVTVGCSSYLKEFLCRVYVPECSEQGRMNVCRSLCNVVREGCLSVMRNFGFRWPSELKCSKFPTSNCVGIPSTAPIGIDTTTAPSSEQQCEPITIELCSSDSSYNTTIYPNMLGDKNQQEAEYDMEMFLPLFQMNCTSHLREFLCRVYVPECGDQGRKNVCRSLCEAAHGGCSHVKDFLWPFSLNCFNFPTTNCESSSGTIPAPTTITATTASATTRRQRRVDNLLKQSASSARKLPRIIRKTERFLHRAHQVNGVSGDEIEGYSEALLIVIEMKRKAEQLSRLLENMTS